MPVGSLPPWFNDRERRRDQNRRSKKQEQARAREVGGKRQRGSGSSHRAPRDVRSDDYLEEIKFTDSQRFTIDARDFKKLQQQGRQLGRGARYVVEFPDLRLIIEAG